LRSDIIDILDYFSDIIYIFNFNFQQLNFHIDASSCMLCRLLFIICMSSIYSSLSVTDHVDFHPISWWWWWWHYDHIATVSNVLSTSK